MLLKRCPYNLTSLIIRINSDAASARTFHVVCPSQNSDQTSAASRLGPGRLELVAGSGSRGGASVAVMADW